MVSGKELQRWREKRCKRKRGGNRENSGSLHASKERVLGQNMDVKCLRNALEVDVQPSLSNLSFPLQGNINRVAGMREEALLPMSTYLGRLYGFPSQVRVGGTGRMAPQHFWVMKNERITDSLFLRVDDALQTTAYWGNPIRPAMAREERLGAVQPNQAGGVERSHSLARAIAPFLFRFQEHWGGTNDGSALWLSNEGTGGSGSLNLALRRPEPAPSICRFPPRNPDSWQKRKKLTTS